MSGESNSVQSTKSKERVGFDRRMSREEINALPIRRFEGRVEVITESSAARRAVELLNRERILGFDTETRPAFRKGERYLPSVLQLAGEKDVYLFQIGRTGLSEDLCTLLENPDILKAGVAPGQDIGGLCEIRPFTAGGFMDISDMAKRTGIKNHGLRGMAAVLLGFRISKQAQVSNWARHKLSEAQISYAAMDAWLSRHIYLHLLRLMDTLPESKTLCAGT
jgi:ribonuclease D